MQPPQNGAEGRTAQRHEAAAGLTRRKHRGGSKLRNAQCKAVALRGGRAAGDGCTAHGRSWPLSGEGGGRARGNHICGYINNAFYCHTCGRGALTWRQLRRFPFWPSKPCLARSL